MALHKNGVKDNRIVGAIGAVHISGIPPEAIERFQKRVEAVNFIGTEDVNAIVAKIKEYAAKDPGAYDADPMDHKVKNWRKTEAGGLKPKVSCRVGYCRKPYHLAINREMMGIGNLNKFHAGVHAEIRIGERYNDRFGHYFDTTRSATGR